MAYERSRGRLFRMRKVIVWLLWAVFTLALWGAGYYSVADDKRPQFLSEEVRKMLPLIQDNWVALGFLTLALSSSLLWLVAPAAYGFLHLRVKKEITAHCGLREPISDPNQAVRMSAGPALHHIARSRWAVREYIRLNGMLDRDSIIDQFHGAARAGRIRAAGVPPGDISLAWIPPHYWDSARLDPSTIMSPRGASSVVFTRNLLGFNSRPLVNYDSISVVRSDLFATWSSASWTLRKLAHLRVSAKKLYFRYSPDIPPFRSYKWTRINDNAANGEGWYVPRRGRNRD